jgi:hypothetical protein
MLDLGFSTPAIEDRRAAFFAQLTRITKGCCVHTHTITVLHCARITRGRLRLDTIHAVNQTALQQLQQYCCTTQAGSSWCTQDLPQLEAVPLRPRALNNITLRIGYHSFILLRQKPDQLDKQHVNPDTTLSRHAQQHTPTPAAVAAAAIAAEDPQHLVCVCPLGQCLRVPAVTPLGHRPGVTQHA